MKRWAKSGVMMTLDTLASLCHLVGGRPAPGRLGPVPHGVALYGELLCSPHRADGDGRHAALRRRADRRNPDDHAASVLLIAWLLLLFHVVASRFLLQKLFNTLYAQKNLARKRAIIYGAGDASRQLMRILKMGAEYNPVLFVDDNAQLHELDVMSLKVKNPADLPRLVKEHAVSSVFLAIPTLTQARRMIHLSGFTVSDADVPTGHGIKIDFIGLRAGEKLHEELFIGDQVQPTQHPKIMVVAEPCLARGELDEFLARLQRACAQNDSSAVVAVLHGKIM